MSIVSATGMKSQPGPLPAHRPHPGPRERVSLCLFQFEKLSHRAGMPSASGGGDGKVITQESSFAPKSPGRSQRSIGAPLTPRGPQLEGGRAKKAAWGRGGRACGSSWKRRVGA